MRIGTPERDAAVAALDTHWHAGRLDPGEHERRTTLAKAARTRTELDALFADLPTGWPRGCPHRATRWSRGRLQRPPRRGSPSRPCRPWAGCRRHRTPSMALTPFVALALVLLTHTWLWFLLIPVMGILLFGADDREGRPPVAAAEPRPQARTGEPGIGRGDAPAPSSRSQASTSRARSAPRALGEAALRGGVLGLALRRLDPHRP